MDRYFGNVLAKAGQGADAAFGGYMSGKNNPMSTAGFVRDIAIESLPGDQRVSLDNPVFGTGNRTISAANDISAGDIVGAGVRNQSNVRAGKVREGIAENVLGAGIRKAGSAIAKKIPGVAAKIAAGSSASAGVLAPVMAAWGAYDLADTGVAAATGKSIGEWAVEPAKIRGRSGAQRAINGY